MFEYSCQIVQSVEQEAWKEHAYMDIGDFYLSHSSFHTINLIRQSSVSFIQSLLWRRFVVHTSARLYLLQVCVHVMPCKSVLMSQVVFLYHWLGSNLLVFQSLAFR